MQTRFSGNQIDEVDINFTDNDLSDLRLLGGGVRMRVRPKGDIRSLKDLDVTLLVDEKTWARAVSATKKIIAVGVYSLTIETIERNSTVPISTSNIFYGNGKNRLSRIYDRLEMEEAA